MTKQECAIKYITENYLDYRRLRHDIVADKLQVRVAHSLEDASLQNAPMGLQFRGSESWREMTKHDINSIVCHCAQEYDANITSREVMTALQSDLIPDVHPLREYINALPRYTPDQPDWIDFVAQQVRVRESSADRPKGLSERTACCQTTMLLDRPYGAERPTNLTGEADLTISEAHGLTSNSSQRERSKADRLWRACFKKWFVAMVASWMMDEVVNHQVLVLIGKQGIFKTTWLEHLIPPHLRAYACKLANSNDLNKDERLRIAEFGLISLDEIDSMNNRELNQLKSVITATDVNERAAYAYTKERRVRLASFCASGNRRDFLTDITGNRRWLPFEVESIQNPFYTIIPYERLYAQAKALVEEGIFSYWFDMEEMEVLEAHNEEFRALENEEELLPLLFDKPAEGKGEFMTTAEISDRLATYGGIKKPMSIRKLNAILEHHEFKAARPYVDGKQVRGWLVYKRKQDEIEIKQKELANKSQRHEDILY